jgi:hypothetical protein
VEIEVQATTVVTFQTGGATLRAATPTKTNRSLFSAKFGTINKKIAGSVSPLTSPAWT